MDWLWDLAGWAWARHHNEWNWYIRPLFLIPYSWFAWRRSLVGILVTLIALATSMFWFPAPEIPSPMTVEVLAAERNYLLAPWSLWKVAIALLVPGTLFALALAFWKRSFAWGLFVVNAIYLAKVSWTFVFFSAEGARHHLVPATIGLVICNAVLLAARHWLRRSRAASGSGQARAR